MEALLVLVGLVLVVGLPVGALMGMLAWGRLAKLTTQVEMLHAEVERLRQRLAEPKRSPTVAPGSTVAEARADGAQAAGIARAREQLEARLDQPAAGPAPASGKPAAPALPPAAKPAALASGSATTAVSAAARAGGVPPPVTAATVAPPVSAPVPEPSAAAPAASPASTPPARPAAPVGASSSPPASPPVTAPSAPPAPAAQAAPALWLSPVDEPAAAPASPRPRVPAPVRDLEAIIGKRWLTWCGVGLVFLSAVFLLKYAYDQDWLGHYITPPLRIAGMALAAAGMVAAGLRLLNQGMTALGHGLAGGGIALAYLAVYGGFSPAVMLVKEPLFPGQLAFALMALITAVGMTLAVRADALAMAVCALLGGFATPVLIDTGGGSREALFTYVLLLDLGVLGAAWFRRWRALDVLAFVGTVVLYAGWQYSREGANAAPWGMLAWLAVFHLLFVLLPFAYHWRTRTVVTMERFALAVGNLAFTLGYAGVLLREREQAALALVCLALAGLYAAIGAGTRARIPGDDKVVHGFLALGTMLLTLGLFYLLPVEAVATAWVAEATALLALGYRYRHGPSRLAAHVVLGCALLRLVVTRLPPADLAAGFIVNAWLLSLLVAPLGLAALALVHRWYGGRRWQALCWWLAGAILLLVGSGEIARHAAGHPQAWILLPQASLHGGWWLLGGLGYLAAAWRWRSRTTALLALLPALLAVVAALAAYAEPWPGGVAVGNPRFLLALAAIGGVLAWMRVGATSSARVGDHAALQPVLLVLAQLATVLLATVETMAWFDRPLVEGAVAASTSTDLHLTLTVVWAVLALASLLLAVATGRRLLAQVGWLPLAAAVAAGFLLYARDFAPQTLVANARFLVLVLAVAVVGCQRLAFPRVPWIPSLAQVLATAAVTCELACWSHDHFSHDLAQANGLWAVALAWAGSALIAARRWRRGASTDACWLALGLALLAGVPALAVFATAWTSTLPFLNLRVLAPAAAVAALVGCWKARGVRTPPDGLRRDVLAWSAVAVGFISCTCEGPVHFHHAIADAAQADRVATFSVTVVWVVLAALALAVGFRWRRRVVRFLALGLFALTAAKLLLVDMQGVQQLYRILAFMLVGVTLIAASYAYHRLERRFMTREEPAPPPAGA